MVYDRNKNYWWRHKCRLPLPTFETYDRKPAIISQSWPTNLSSVRWNGSLKYVQCLDLAQLMCVAGSYSVETQQYSLVYFLYGLRNSVESVFMVVMVRHFRISYVFWWSFITRTCVRNRPTWWMFAVHTWAPAGFFPRGGGIRGLGQKSPSGVQERSGGGGLGAKPPEADDMFWK